MDIEQAIVTITDLLPKDIRFHSKREETEEEEVAWDFNGNVTAIEYTSTPLEDKTCLSFYWDEAQGRVGIETLLLDTDLAEMTLVRLATLVRVVILLKEQREQKAKEGSKK